MIMVVDLNIDHVKTDVFVTSKFCSFLFSEQRESNLISIFGLAESERLFVKCREEFRQSVKYPGAIYSDFPPVENSLPYFHISDEYRMFNPEGKTTPILLHFIFYKYSIGINNV